MRSWHVLPAGLGATFCLLVACSESSNLAPTPAGPSFAAEQISLVGPRATAAVAFDPGGPNVAWTTNVTDGWLAVTPASGTGPGTLTIAVDLGAFPPGTYQGAVRLATPLGTVVLRVGAAFAAPGTPNMVFSPTSLDFGADQVTLTAELVDNTGLGLAWSVTELVGWARVAPRSGAGNGTVTVTIDRNRLPRGTTAGTIRATFQGGAANLALRATVGDQPVTVPPLLEVSPAALGFTVGGPVSATLNLAASSPAVVWNTTSSATWLTATPPSGLGSGSVTVTVDPTGLDIGVHSAALRISYASSASRQAATTEVVVPVSVLVPSPIDQPQLALSPAALIYGLAESVLPLALTNVGGPGTLTWAAQSSADWVTIAPASGTGNAALQVTVDRANPNAAAGSAIVTVASDGGTAAVEIVLARQAGVVGGPTQPFLSVEPGLLDFGTATSQQTLRIRNLGAAGLTWSLTPSEAWISPAPTSGVEDADVAVTINRAALTEGANIGSIVLLSNVGTATILVSATRPGGVATPQLLVNPTFLDFGAGLDQRTFNIVNAGGGTLTWSVTPSTGWLTVTPPNGTNNATVTVNLDRATLAPGQQNAVLQVSSDGGNANIQVSATGN